MGPQCSEGEPRRVVIVGAGIIGLATAREVAARHPEATVTVIDKESRVAAHQTGHNSGVIHAGLYYEPGSLKAVLCRRGGTLLREFCQRHSVAVDTCGKLVVATRHEELSRLADIQRRARANGVPGIETLTPAEMREIEPHVRGLAAVHSPDTAIVDYGAVSRALAEELMHRSVSVRLGIAVQRVESSVDGVHIEMATGERLVADRVLVCAGLHVDRLARASGEPRAPRIVPFRGEYWQLRPERAHLVRGLIYPVPDPTLPFLGVHLTKRVDGAVLIGPNAVLALAREGYRWRTISGRDTVETLGSRGAWRLFARHWRTGLSEIARSASRRLFVEAARKYVPEIDRSDVVRSAAGVRAQAINDDGTLIDDFRIEISGRTVWVRNAPSPAATSSFAIAEELASRL